MTASKNRFQKMRDRFNMKGWIRGSYVGPNGEVCLLQCAQDVGLSTKDQDLLLKAANQLYAPKGASSYWGGIPSFNDAEGRTVSQVVAVVKRAEELAEA